MLQTLKEIFRDQPHLAFITMMVCLLSLFGLVYLVSDYLLRRRKNANHWELAVAAAYNETVPANAVEDNQTRAESPQNKVQGTRPKVKNNQQRIPVAGKPRYVRSPRKIAPYRVEQKQKSEPKQTIRESIKNKEESTPEQQQEQYRNPLKAAVRQVVDLSPKEKTIRSQLKSVSLQEKEEIKKETTPVVSESEAIAYDLPASLTNTNLSDAKTETKSILQEETPVIELTTHSITASGSLQEKLPEHMLDMEQPAVNFISSPAADEVRMPTDTAEQNAEARTIVETAVPFLELQPATIDSIRGGPDTINPGSHQPETAAVATVAEEITEMKVDVTKDVNEELLKDQTRAMVDDALPTTPVETPGSKAETTTTRDRTGMKYFEFEEYLPESAGDVEELPPGTETSIIEQDYLNHYLQDAETRTLLDDVLSQSPKGLETTLPIEENVTQPADNIPATENFGSENRPETLAVDESLQPAGGTPSSTQIDIVDITETAESKNPSEDAAPDVVEFNQSLPEPKSFSVGEENFQEELQHAETGASPLTDKDEAPAESIDMNNGRLLFIGYKPNKLFAQTEPWSYPSVSMPQPGCIVRTPTTQSIRPGEMVEDIFQLEMRRTFPAFEIAGNDCIPVSANSKPYEPDISLMVKGFGLNLFIDVEIDEPYDGVKRTPRHCLNEDQSKDCLTAGGWIVIRFAEVQAHKQPKHCLAFIARVIHSVYPEYHIPSDLRDLPAPRAVSQWTKEVAEKMAASRFREQYLEITQFEKNPSIR